MKRFNKEFFNISFSEGGLPTLEIGQEKLISWMKVNFLFQNRKIMKFIIIIASSNFNDLVF